MMNKNSLKKPIRKPKHVGGYLCTCILTSVHPYILLSCLSCTSRQKSKITKQTQFKNRQLLTNKGLIAKSNWVRFPKRTHLSQLSQSFTCLGYRKSGVVSPFMCLEAHQKANLDIFLTNARPVMSKLLFASLRVTPHFNRQSNIENGCHPPGCPHFCLLPFTF